MSANVKPTKPVDAECWWCGLAVLGVFALLVSPFVALFWDVDAFVKLRVALQYGDKPFAHWPTVTIDKEPHDCDFMTAPIGIKHCHYERVVMAAPPWDRKRIEIHYAKFDE